MGVGLEGKGESSGQTEVSQFDCAFLVNQDIVWLEISVEGSVRVTVADSNEALVHDFLQG